MRAREAKQNGIYAHGTTLHEAQEALLNKLFDDMPEDERIKAFVEAHKWGAKYPAADLYEWHHRLTGSCEQGRKEFARAHGINLETDSFTVAEAQRIKAYFNSISPEQEELRIKTLFDGLGVTDKEVSAIAKTYEQIV